MSVIPFSQLSLSRTRKQLAGALDDDNWESVSSLDKNLIQALNKAAEDPDRDANALINELGHILSVYKELVEGCQQKVGELAGSQG